MSSAARRRVLVVVSSYRPAMLADMQRARMLARELPALGWDVEVLTPASGEVRSDAREPEPAAFFAGTEAIHEAGSLARPLFRALGSRSPAWRTWLPMAWQGDRLLATGRFDLVYLSTTTFAFFGLGARWRRRFRVPYVLDFHDPWVRPDAGARGGLKARAAAGLARRMEADAVPHASGIVAVAEPYLAMLRERYGARAPAWMAPGRSAVIPFAALESDLAAVGAPRAAAPGGEIDVVYVGAGGTVMARAFATLCRLVAQLRARRDPRVERLRIGLFGTQFPWRAGDRRALEEIARAHGLGARVAEHPERVSYRRSLELLAASHGALVLGVEDAAYMPSKLFSYALSGKPLLAVLHESGAAYALLRDNPALGHAVALQSGEDGSASEPALAALAAFLGEAESHRMFDRRAPLRPYLAPAMARRHVELFEACRERR